MKEEELAMMDENRTNTSDITLPKNTKSELTVVARETERPLPFPVSADPFHEEDQTNTDKLPMPEKKAVPEVSSSSSSFGPQALPGWFERRVPFAIVLAMGLGFAALSAAQWWEYSRLARRVASIENVGLYRSTGIAPVAARQSKASVDSLKQSMSVMARRLQKLEEAVSGKKAAVARGLGSKSGNRAKISSRKSKTARNAKTRPVAMVDFSR